MNNWFRLSPRRTENGTFCGRDGLFIGGTPLLERAHGKGGAEEWLPRRTTELNHDLGKLFGLPVECDSKIGGIAAVARALNRGDVALAQIAALHLQIPDPPLLTKSPRSSEEIVELALRLNASGMLKADWDPDLHPRWPAGSPDGIGGEFAPADEGCILPTVRDVIADVESRLATTGPPKRSRQNSTQETHVRPILAIANWITPATLELDEAEIIEEVGAEIGLKPGPFAEESVPASGPKITSEEQIQINRIGSKSGCHTCGTKVPGTKSGNWIGDHQPSNALNSANASQRLYPHCLTCSLRQGGIIRWLLNRRLWSRK